MGKTVHYRCHLCECVFGDAKSRFLHEKGKRHQLALRRFKSVTEMHPNSSAALTSTPSVSTSSTDPIPVSR